MKWLLNSKGNSLALVLVILIFFTTISLAIIPATQVSYKSAVDQQLSQQAYFNARTAADTIIKYIINNPNNVSNILNTNGKSTDTTNSDFDVSVTQNGDVNHLKIKATGYYPNRTSSSAKSSTIYAYLSKSSSTSSSVNPYKYLFYTTGAGSTVSAGSITGDIFTTGIFDYNNDGTINGNVYAKAGFIGRNNGTITGSVFTDGIADFEGSTKVNKDVTCGSDIKLNNGGAKINGNLFYARDYYIGNAKNSGNLSQYVAGTSTHQAVAPLNLDVNFSQLLPNLSIGSNMPQNNYTITNNQTITTSGILKDDTNSATITFDTGSVKDSTKDIYIYIGNNINLQSSVFYVKGKNNVYVYIKDGCTLTLSGGAPFFGMKIATDIPQLYFLGDTGNILLQSEAIIEGFVYLPNGSLTISGGTNNLRAFNFRGASVVKTMLLTGSTSMVWAQPNLLGTPIQILDPTLNSNGVWSVASWSNS